MLLLKIRGKGIQVDKTRVPDPYEKCGCWDQGKSDLTKLYLSKSDYKQPGAMFGVSQIILFLTHLIC